MPMLYVRMPNNAYPLCFLKPSDYPIYYSSVIRGFQRGLLAQCWLQLYVHRPLPGSGNGGACGGFAGHHCLRKVAVTLTYVII